MKDMMRVLTAGVLALAVAGCNQTEQKKAPLASANQSHVTKKEAVVVIPENVKGKWKAVVIEVTDKTTNKQTPFTVPIGSSFTVPNTGLAVKVENFLPQFTMEGTTLTSLSNDPKNPAAQVRVMEGGKEVFKGWLFTLYPTTHAFQHPRYGFVLADFVPGN